MTATDYKIAGILKKRLTKLCPIIDFRVFGSRARGDSEESSDMDVFLQVAALSPELKREIRRVAWEVGLENLLLISTLIFTKNEIEETVLRSSPIVKNIMEHGIEI